MDAGGTGAVLDLGAVQYSTLLYFTNDSVDYEYTPYRGALQCNNQFLFR